MKNDRQEFHLPWLWGKKCVLALLLVSLCPAPLPALAPQSEAQDETWARRMELLTEYRMALQEAQVEHWEKALEIYKTMEAEAEDLLREMRLYGASPEKMEEVQGMLRRTKSITGKWKIPLEIQDGQALLKKNRTLVVAPDADAVDERLFLFAQKTGTPYLRLTLRNLEEWYRTRTEIVLDGKELKTLPGPLNKIVESGGILLIDYEGSHPKAVEGLNSLFGPDPYFHGKKASPELKIVGVIDPQRLAASTSSFASRFDSVLERDWLLEGLPGGNWPGEADPEGRDVVLNGTPFFREKLLGRYALDDSGNAVWIEGPLVEALRRETPINLRGADRSDPALSQFLRQFRMQGGVRANGQWYPAQGRFSLAIIPPDFRQGVRDKTITRASRLPGRQFVVNARTQDILFSIPAIDPVTNHLVVRPGLLEAPPEGKPLKLKVTGPLMDWVWHGIMHAPGSIEVEIGPDATIPAEYQDLGDPAGEAREQREKTLSQAEDDGDRAICVATDDALYALSHIRQRVANPLVFYVTPTTRKEDLLGELDVSTGPGGDRKFFRGATDVSEALAEGRSVVLMDLECNSSLAEELQTLMAQQPYLSADGGELTKGRIFLVGPEALFKPADAIVQLNGRREALYQQLRLDVMAGRPGSDLRREDFDKLMQLKEAFDTLPPPQPPGLYPAEAAFTYPRLKQIVLRKPGDWPAAVQDIFIDEYRDAAEEAAFLRAAVRIILGDAKIPAHSINGEDLRRVLSRLHETSPLKSSLWQLAQAVSPDLLVACEVQPDFAKPQGERLLDTLKDALIADSRGDQREMYQAKFGKEDVNLGAPAIRHPAKEAPGAWDLQRAGALQALKEQRAIFLKGYPGVGKSYMAELLAGDLKYSQDKNAVRRVFGPVTSGPDVQPADLIRRKGYKDGATVYQDEVIAQWAQSPKGGLLLVDEANMTPEGFWNFLKGFFSQEPHAWIGGLKIMLTPEHRVIFTGNQEWTTGRRYHAVLREYFRTFYLAPFDDAFLEKIMEEKYLSKKASVRRPELIRLLVELYRVFEKMDTRGYFSLRDLQQLSDGINYAKGVLSPDGGWEKAAVVNEAWKAFGGNFTPEERTALGHVLMKKFGADVFAMDAAEDADEPWLNVPPGTLTQTWSTRKLIRDIQKFLDSPRRRLRRKAIQGKGGMLIEGPSGRGKDEVILAALKSRGFADGDDPQSRNIPPRKKYYRVNASVDVDKLIATVRRAQKEGSIVILSELNLLPSALLEGRLSDVLTGDAADGFGFFATINSSDFQGREKFSSALRNRLWYRRIEDYHAGELLEIAAAQAPEVPREALQYLVGAHAWIRRSISEEDADQKPTAREILKAVQLLKEGIEAPEAVEAVYGVVFLRGVMGEAKVPADLGPAQDWDNPPDNKDILRLIAEFMNPEKTRPIRLKLDAAILDKGYHDEEDNAVALRAQNTMRENLVTLDHEIGHILFTRHRVAELVPGVRIADDRLEMWLEDERQASAMRRYYPHAREDDAQNALFLEILSRGDVRKIQAMHPRDLFKHLLSGFALGYVSRDTVSDLAKVLSGGISPNPAALALPHLDSAKKAIESLPESMDEQAMELAQYRAAKYMAAMVSDYGSLPPYERKEPVPSPEEQERQILNGQKTIARADLTRLSAGTTPAPAKPEDISRVWKNKAAAIPVPEAPAAPGFYEKLKGKVRGWMGGSASKPVSAPAAPVQPEPIPQTHEPSPPYNPVDLAVAPVSPVSMGMRLKSREYVDRNSLYQRIFRDHAPEIRAAWENLYRREIQFERVYGTEGALDVLRLLTGDPATAFYRTGATETVKPKEFVYLQAGGDYYIWDDILQESFLTLFSQGMVVHIYTLDGRMQEGISTLGDFGEILLGHNKGRLVDPEKMVLEHHRKLPVLTYPQIRKRVDGIVLASLMEGVRPETLRALAEPGPRTLEAGGREIGPDTFEPAWREKFRDAMVSRDEILDFLASLPKRDDIRLKVGEEWSMGWKDLAPLYEVKKILKTLPEPLESLMEARQALESAGRLDAFLGMADYLSRQESYRNKEKLLQALRWVGRSHAGISDPASKSLDAAVAGNAEASALAPPPGGEEFFGSLASLNLALQIYRAFREGKVTPGGVPAMFDRYPGWTAAFADAVYMHDALLIPAQKVGGAGFLKIREKPGSAALLEPEMVPVNVSEKALLKELGLHYLKSKKYKPALRAYIAALGGYGNVEKHYENLLSGPGIFGNDPGLRAELGWLQLGSGKTREARDSFKDAGRISFAGDRQRELGKIFAMVQSLETGKGSKDWKNAHERLNKAVSPQSPLWGMYAGLIYFRAGKKAEAIKAFEYALDRDPGNAHAWRALAFVLKDTNQEAKADWIRRWLDGLPSQEDAGQARKLLLDSNRGVDRLEGGDIVDKSAWAHDPATDTYSLKRNPDFRLERMSSGFFGIKGLEGLLRKISERDRQIALAMKIVQDRSVSRSERVLAAQMLNRYQEPSQRVQVIESLAGELRDLERQMQSANAGTAAAKTADQDFQDQMNILGQFVQAQASAALVDFIVSGPPDLAREYASRELARLFAESWPPYVLEREQGIKLREYLTDLADAKSIAKIRNGALERDTLFHNLTAVWERTRGLELLPLYLDVIETCNHPPFVLRASAAVKESRRLYGSWKQPLDVQACADRLKGIATSDSADMFRRVAALAALAGVKEETAGMKALAELMRDSKLGKYPRLKAVEVLSAWAKYGDLSTMSLRGKIDGETLLLFFNAVLELMKEGRAQIALGIQLSPEAPPAINVVDVSELFGLMLSVLLRDGHAKGPQWEAMQADVRKVLKELEAGTLAKGPVTGALMDSRAVQYTTLKAMGWQQTLPIALAPQHLYYARREKAEPFPLHEYYGVSSPVSRELIGEHDPHAAFLKGLFTDIGVKELLEKKLPEGSAGKDLADMVKADLGDFYRDIVALEEAVKQVADGKMHHGLDSWRAVLKIYGDMQERDIAGLSANPYAKLVWQRDMSDLVFAALLDEGDVDTPKSRPFLRIKLLHAMVILPQDVFAAEFPGTAGVTLADRWILIPDTLFALGDNLPGDVNTVGHEARHWLRGSLDIGLLGAAVLYGLEYDIQFLMLQPEEPARPLQRIVEKIKRGTALQADEEWMPEDFKEGVRLAYDPAVQGPKTAMLNIFHFDHPLHDWPWREIVHTRSALPGEIVPAYTAAGKEYREVDTYREGAKLAGYAVALCQEAGYFEGWQLFVELLAKDPEKYWGVQRPRLNPAEAYFMILALGGFAKEKPAEMDLIESNIRRAVKADIRRKGLPGVSDELLSKRIFQKIHDRVKRNLLSSKLSENAAYKEIRSRAGEAAFEERRKLLKGWNIQMAIAEDVLKDISAARPAPFASPGWSAFESAQRKLDASL